MSDAVQTAPADLSVQAPDDFQQYAAWRAGDQAAETLSEAAEAPPAETAPESDTGDDDQDDSPRKGKGGFQRRIDKLTRANYELQARLQALEATGGQPAARQSEPEQTTQQRPRPEQFDDYDAYVEALADWKTEQKLEQRIAMEQQALVRYQQQQQEENLTRTFQKRAKAAAAKYADFADVAFSDEVPVSDAMRAVILESEAGPDLAYWLGSNPQEAERIAQLPAIAAARELGRIEASLAAPAQPKPQPRVTRAPEPIRPVTAAAKTSPNILDDNFANDYTAWERARKAQLRR